MPALGRAGDADLVAVYLRWIWWRALLHRGWWLVTSVYLVVDVGLSPSQLVVIGVAQALVGVVFEIPAGVVADTIGRKPSLLVSHVLMGAAMSATGVVTDFTALLGTQMLWGLSWTFASGADVAWITDELDQRGQIDRVLVRSGRADLTGAASGIVALGALGALLDRSVAMVGAGAAMALLGLYVLRFPEQRFLRTETGRWAASWSILVRGATVARRSRMILVVVAATFLVNGAENVGRLQPKRLVDLGLPTDPVAWFTALALSTLLVGAGALRVIESRIDGTTARPAYGVACAAGAVGAATLAVAPDEVTASAGVVLVGGVATPLTRAIATIWINRETIAEVRATMHSLLAQAEYVGEIVCGVAIAIVAARAGLSAALLASGVLFGINIVLIRRAG